MEKLKIKNQKVFLVILCSLVYFVSYFSRKDFAAVLAAMPIEDTVGGLIGMGLFICYGVGQLVSGFLGDKIKPSYLIIFGLSTTSVCNLLMPLVTNEYAMIPIWAVNGFAQAMLWPPIVRILSDNLDSEAFVKANLVVTAAAHISTILLYLYVPFCLTYFEWETVFFTATVLALSAMALFVLSLILIIPADAIRTPVKKDIPSDTEEGSVNYFALITRAGILPIFCCIIMMGILRDGIETWLPTFYKDSFGRGAEESILLSVALPIFSILSIVIITALHKTRVFKNEVLGSIILFGIVAVIAVPIVFLMSLTNLIPRILCLILACTVCACMHGTNFLLISCLPGRFSKYGKAATTSGFCNAFTYVGAAISSFGFAVLADNFGWSAVVICWIAVGALGVLFTLLSIKSYTHFIKKED